MEFLRVLLGYEVFYLIEELDVYQKRYLFSEMVKILKRIEDFEFFLSIKSFGDVIFDEFGEIVSVVIFFGDFVLW